MIGLDRQFGRVTLAAVVLVAVGIAVLGCRKKDDSSGGPSGAVANAVDEQEKGDLVTVMMGVWGPISWDSPPYELMVRLEVEPGWHVYWKYPGDAGLPTTIEFTGPEGVELESVYYPLPIRFEQPGEIAGYGYKGTVDLIASIRLPEDFDEEDPPKLHAKVSWLACKDVCIPGQAEVVFDFSAQQTFMDVENIEQAYESMLQPYAEAEQEDLKIERQDNARGQIELSVRVMELPVRVSAVEDVFPAPPKGFDLLDFEYKTKDGELVLSARLQPLPHVERDGAMMEFLVVYRDGQGQRRGYVVPVSL